MSHFHAHTTPPSTTLPLLAGRQARTNKQPPPSHTFNIPIHHYLPHLHHCVPPYPTVSPASPFHSFFPPSLPPFSIYPTLHTICALFAVHVTRLLSLGGNNVGWAWPRAFLAGRRLKKTRRPQIACIFKIEHPTTFLLLLWRWGVHCCCARLFTFAFYRRLPATTTLRQPAARTLTENFCTPRWL